MKDKSILVVDDSLANLKLMCLLLENEGFLLKTAENADEALEVLKAFHPDLILMDIQLPGMDGLTLTSQIKQDPKLKDIVIVALTAYAMKGDAKRAKASGCAGYITKPIDTRTFTDTMLQIISHKGEHSFIGGDLD